MFLFNTLIETFEPIATPINAYFWAWLFLMLVLVGLSFYLYQKKASYENRNRKNLLQLLVMFGALICFGVVLFTFINSQRIQAIQVYDDQVILPSETIPFQQLKRAYIHVDQQGSHLSPQIVVDTSYLLVFEKMDGKTFVFSNDYYDIGNIARSINDAMK